MRGLLLNNLYSMQSNINLSFIIALIVSFVPVILGEPNMLIMVVSMQILIFPLNVGTSLQTDEISKWCKLEITLPVKRSSIVNAKYISFIILILIGILTSSLTLILSSLTGIGFGNINIFYGYSYGLSLAISTVSILYPLILKFGAEKSEMIIVVSACFSVALQFLAWMMLNLFMSDINFNGVEVTITSVVFSIFLFIISYILSLKIQYSKEF